MCVYGQTEILDRGLHGASAGIVPLPEGRGLPAGRRAAQAAGHRTAFQLKCRRQQTISEEKFNKNVK